MSRSRSRSRSRSMSRNSTEQLLRKLMMSCNITERAAKKLYNKIVADDSTAYVQLRTKCLREGLDVDEVNDLYSRIQESGYIGGKRNKTRRANR